MSQYLMLRFTRVRREKLEENSVGNIGAGNMVPGAENSVSGVLKL